MLPVDTDALKWLRAIRLTLITRKVRVSETIYYSLDADGLKMAQRAKPGVPAFESDISPHSLITREVARASKTAVRFLRRRGLTRDDREDVLQDAILWCLQNRDNYSLTTSLETWFINAVRDAYKRLKRHRERVLYYSEVSDGNLQDDD